jgi:predicted Zn-dependent peptidase
MWDPYAELQHVQLPNGLTVYLGTWDRPWIGMKVVVHAGAKDDPLGKDGVAHFVEHLVSDNIDGWTKEQADNFFDDIGGEARFGSTGYVATEYSFLVPFEGDNLTKALSVFGGMLISSTIENSLERERDVILNEYMRCFPMSILAPRIAVRRKAFFDVSRLGSYLRPVGKLDTIPLITLDDIRDFYARYYTPANISIVAVGGVELTQFVAALQASPFGATKAGARVPLPPSLSAVGCPGDLRLDYNASDMMLQKPNQSGIEIQAALPNIVSREVVARASDVLREVLMREIREKRSWTYDCDVDWTRFPEAYEMSVTIKFPWEHIDAVEALVDACVANASESVDVIERHIRRSCLAYKIQDPNGRRVVEASCDELAEFGRVRTVAEDTQASASVTVEQVQWVLQSLTSERRLTGLLRP